MKRFAMMLVAMSLLGCTSGYGMSATPSDPTKSDVAKAAEEKGDLARIHNNYESATYYYAAALHVSRKNPVLYNKLGIAQLQLGENGPAHKSFGQALKYDPKYIAAMNNMGAVLLLEKKYNQAIDYFKRALAIDETNASTHVNIAEAWLGLGQIDRAMTEYSRALELNADLLTSSENGVIAQVKTPEQRARIAYLIAKSYIKRGNVEGALEYLNRAKELHYPDLGKVYSDQEFAVLWQDPRLTKIIKR